MRPKVATKGRLRGITEFCQTDLVWLVKDGTVRELPYAEYASLPTKEVALYRVRLSAQKAFALAAQHFKRS